MSNELPEDPLEALDLELRRRVGGEFRRTAEGDEYAARKATLRRRGLAEVVYELLSRGDTVRVTVGATTLRGVISHARGTLATLEPGEGAAVHINLAGPLIIDVIERSPSGGRPPEAYGPETFVARLRELELNEVAVEVITGFSEERPSGVIEAVGADHLMLRGATVQYVPLAWVGAVRVVAR